MTLILVILILFVIYFSYDPDDTSSVIYKCTNCGEIYIIQIHNFKRPIECNCCGYKYFRFYHGGKFRCLVHLDSKLHKMDKEYINSL